GHQGEHPGGVRHRKVATSGHLRGRLEPCGREVRLCPEAHGVGLCVRPLRGLQAAHVLGFIVIARIERTVESRRGPGTELTRAVHAPRLCRCILREQRRRRRHPHTRRGYGTVRVRYVCRVTLTI